MFIIETFIHTQIFMNQILNSSPLRDDVIQLQNESILTKIKI